MIHWMSPDSAARPRLLALSDLHVGYPENRAILEGLPPGSAGDWLIVAGDVDELFADIDSFLPEIALTKPEALAYAYWTGVVCTDEAMLHPDPYDSREAWCWARIEETERRLAGRDPDLPVILVNHWPLVREPTRILRYPEFALWCETDRTADWHTKYNAVAVVYGHLHIPRTTWYDGVRFEEVPVGYPREWRRRTERPSISDQPRIPRQILPVPDIPDPRATGVFR